MCPDMTRLDRISGMPYRNMTLDDLARHIGMDAREVRRMAERGDLPGQMIGGRWRFNRMQMLDWLQTRMHTLDPQQIQRLENAMADGGDDELISRLIAPEGIELNLPARSKASVLRELINLAERTGQVLNRAALVQALEEREILGATALPGGLALPHPRRPLPEATTEPLICLARVPAGVPFGAPDGGLTDLFVLLLNHDDRAHLMCLARLSLLFGHSPLADALRAAGSRDEALETFVQADRALLATR